LTAAVLAADVNSADFQGACATPIGEFGVPATCDAIVYASGLRNPYDLVWHKNGSLYSTDNGLGVVGSYPPQPTPDCTGLGNTETNNPGTQPDSLYRVVAGAYYGHPNPYRNECVFGDGSFQGVPPLPNYTPRLASLGINKSANGIIDYRGDAFFGRLNGQLLIANFSQGDNITRTQLNAAGDEVIETEVLVTGFNNPLSVAQDNDGNILVAEFGASQMVVLQPTTTGTPAGSFTDAALLPVATLDPEAAAIGNSIYVVAGETENGATQALWIYDSIANSWESGPKLPSVAVEDTATTAYGDRFYVFGGSTGSFSGAVSDAAVFDPQTNAWTTLAAMPTPRGGASAEMINGLIYVIGGIGANGESLNTVEIYNPATNTWAAGPSMLEARDNAGSAVIDGTLYVMGGRTRFTDDTLTSIEIFDVASNAWTPGAPMITGRRSFAVGTVGNRIQAVGGESPALAINEEYDPLTNTWRELTPLNTTRHGAAAGTIGSRLFIIGGGTTEGTSFTDSVTAFSY